MLINELICVKFCKVAKNVSFFATCEKIKFFGWFYTDISLWWIDMHIKWPKYLYNILGDKIILKQLYLMLLYLFDMIKSTFYENISNSSFHYVGQGNIYG